MYEVEIKMTHGWKAYPGPVATIEQARELAGKIFGGLMEWRIVQITRTVVETHEAPPAA